MSRVVIVGAGVVGAATGMGLARYGHDVTFVDTSVERVDALTAEGFTATTEVRLDGGPAFVFLTLPTPSGELGYDLRALTAGVRAVGTALAATTELHVVAVRSTVPPGTCDGLVRGVLETASGGVAGENFLLASNPEFLRAASALDDFLHPWMTVIGSTSPEALDRLRRLFTPFGGELRSFADPAAAELAKCAHNLFNATKISFWNEMWLVSTRLGLDPDEIAGCVARSAEGSLNVSYGIRGGAPFGGACLPKDALGFRGFAADLDIPLQLASAVIEVNKTMERLVGEELEHLADQPDGRLGGQGPRACGPSTSDTIDERTT